MNVCDCICKVIHVHGTVVTNTLHRTAQAAAAAQQLGRAGIPGEHETEEYK